MINLLEKFNMNECYYLERLMLIEPHSSFFQFLWKKILKIIAPETLSKIIALITSKESISFTQNFVKTFPYYYMKSFVDENLIPNQYGGSSSTFKHTVFNYSFDDSDLSTFDSSTVQKPTQFCTSSFVYDLQEIQKLKDKITFVESNIEELVNCL